MRQKRAKAKKSDNVNTHNNVPVTTTSPAKISPLTALLSQYELHYTLCGHLSSADVIHLGQTSKEHWQYVASSPTLRRELIANSSCDGRGIIAQACVFGYWNGNPNSATRTCRGKDARPCVDCGAMTCNECRFHIQYPSAGSLAEEVIWLEHLEGFYGEFLDDAWNDCEMECDDESSDFYIMRNGPSVEMIKASETFYTARVVEHCHDCQPLFMDLDPENYESKEQCQCSLFDHFVAKWRCIPCVLAEQTKSVVSRPKPGSTYLWDVGRANFVERRVFCGCGKRVTDKGIWTCRHCGFATLLEDCELDRGQHLNRVYTQLGTSVDNRSKDPFLSQLG